MLLYRMTHTLSWLLFKVLYRFTIRGMHHVPAEGSVILAANHASFLDPLFVGVAIRQRPIHFMARDNLFRIPFLGWYIRQHGALPIKRGGVNRWALENFLSVLKNEGGALLMFPEGTRSPDGNLGKPHRGVGAMCWMIRAPVIPVFVSGGYEIWPRWKLLPKLFGRIEVRFGPPVQYSEEALNATGDPKGALATLIMKRIGDLQMTRETPLGFWKELTTHFRRPQSAGRLLGARDDTQRAPGSNHAKSG